MNYSIENIKDDLRNKLSEYRYKHSLRVAEEAKRLAKYYGVNEENTYIAGLLHDIAKEYDYDMNKYWINKYKLDNALLNEDNINICHAEIGSIVVKELYGCNEEICNAIRYHNVGNINMTMLDKIIFVADKIESGKDYFGIDEERKLAYEDIDKALMRCILNNKIVLESKGKSLHEESIKLLKFLETKIKE